MLVTTAIINGAVALLLAPIFDGVVRKVKAVIHSRKGPPLVQTYIDIFKLLGKEDLRCTTSAMFRFAPAVVLASFLVVAALTPLGTGGTGVQGDMITWLYFLVLGAAVIIMMAAASANPFASAGAAREMMMLLSVEPIVVAALLTAAVKSQSLRLTDMSAWNIAGGPSISMVTAGIAFFLALQATMGKLPFDISEAESEIVDGPLVEQSGPSLALLKLALLVRQIVYALLMVQIFVPWPVLKSWPLAVLAALIKVLILFVLWAVVEAVNPRMRIDKAMNYMGRLLFVSLAALAFAMIGV
jgi:formate hydrogenlyase subunit 4